MYCISMFTKFSLYKCNARYRSTIQVQLVPQYAAPFVPDILKFDSGHVTKIQFN